MKDRDRKNIRQFGFTGKVFLHLGPAQGGNKGSRISKVPGGMLFLTKKKAVCNRAET